MKVDAPSLKATEDELRAVEGDLKRQLASVQASLQLKAEGAMVLEVRVKVLVRRVPNGGHGPAVLGRRWVHCLCLNVDAPAESVTPDLAVKLEGRVCRVKRASSVLGSRIIHFAMAASPRLICPHAQKNLHCSYFYCDQMCFACVLHSPQGLRRLEVRADKDSQAAAEGLSNASVAFDRALEARAEEVSHCSHISTWTFWFEQCLSCLRQSPWSKGRRGRSLSALTFSHALLLSIAQLHDAVQTLCESIRDMLSHRARH
eukprot:1150749-Pelagomonas_calceolata.AAC.3